MFLSNMSRFALLKNPKTKLGKKSLSLLYYFISNFNAINKDYTDQNASGFVPENC